MKNATQSLLALKVLARPYNAILPLLLIYIGGVLSGASLLILLLGMLVLFLIHSAITIANDIEDIDVDAANGRSPIPITPKILWRIVIGILVAAFFISALFLPVVFTALSITTIVLSWAYNSKPFQFSRRPLSSIVVLGITYGTIPFLMGVSLNLVITQSLLLLSVFFGIGRISLSMLKDYKDAKGDAVHNKRTFLLVYGRTRVRQVSVGLSILGYAVIIALFSLLMPSAWLWTWVLGLIVIAAWLVYERTKLSPKKSYEKLNRQFHSCLHNELVFYGALAIWSTTLLV